MATRNFLALLILVSLFGCATPSLEPGIKITKDNVVSEILTNNLIKSEHSGNTRPGKSRTTFSLDEEIIIYVTVSWNQALGSQLMNARWKWYTDNNLISEYENSAIGKSPYNWWGTFNAFSLGVGEHTVEFLLDENIISQKTFTIVE